MISDKCLAGCKNLAAYRLLLIFYEIKKYRTNYRSYASE